MNRHGPFTGPCFLPQYKGEPADGGFRQLGVKEMSAKPFTITDVGVLLGIQRLSGGNEDSYNVVCPFCGDERGKCNFIVIKNGELVNVYHCFHCGAGGNMLTLYADLNGIYGRSRYQRAYWKIQEELPMDMQESKMREKRVLLRERRCKEQLAELVDYEKRDAIYREMLKLLKLSRSHRDDLRRRGLTEEEISRMEQLGYKSTCAEDSVSIARRLIKSGCNLKGVPGFFVNRNGDWEIAFYKKNSGYLCPVWSAKGCLTAFQIRLDVPYQKRKYVWLSSAKLNKGCSPGSPVSLSGSPEVRRVFVTEGILKAEITHQRTRETYIGNPGVMNHKELKQMLIQLKEQGLREVVEANDMDKLMRLDCREDYGTICRTCSASGSECPKKKEKREQIRKGCIRLYEICEELSLSCSRAAWDTDEEGMWQEQYKGIDDWELQEPEDSYGNMAA